MVTKDKAISEREVQLARQVMTVPPVKYGEAKTGVEYTPPFGFTSFSSKFRLFGGRIGNYDKLGREF